MKEQQTKPTKKKIALYYLALTAVLLVIAAVTVSVVIFARNRAVTDGNQIERPDDGSGNETGEKPDNTDKPQPPDDGNGNNGNENGGNDENGDKPTDGAYAFISPVAEIDLGKAQVFAYDKTLDRYCVHEGVDLKAAAGTEVLCAVDGTVTSVCTGDYLYGAVITVSHANGIETVYKFIDPAENLKAGDAVKRGQVIGTVASATGVENADGDHLHFEVRKNGKAEDPADYIDAISK